MSKPLHEIVRDEMEKFEELTWEEDLENLASGLDLQRYYCCDGRECGCNAETTESVLHRFISGYMKKEKVANLQAVIEIVESKKKDKYGMDAKAFKGTVSAQNAAFHYNQALSDISSLLQDELNKIKEN